MKRILLIAVIFMIGLAACGPTSSQSTTTKVATVEGSTVTFITSIPTSTSTPTDTTTSTPIPTLTNTATPARGIGSTWVSPIDGMVMGYVPEGAFLMGFTGGYSDEQPQHTVTLDAYWIDKIEVTNGLYDLCVQAGACNSPRRYTSNAIDIYYGNPMYADYPVIYVSWIDAQAYCSWADRRLPTEAEWEKAARGTDGRIYPWGNTPPEKSLANFANNIEDITKTGSYPGGASPYGMLDMAGNVWEWTADWYSKNYYSQSPDHNPPGPDDGTNRVLRGGSWNYIAPGNRSSYRFSKEPTFSSYETGIRCVRTEP